MLARSVSTSSYILNCSMQMAQLTFPFRGRKGLFPSPMFCSQCHPTPDTPSGFLSTKSPQSLWKAPPRWHDCAACSKQNQMLKRPTAECDVGSTHALWTGQILAKSVLRTTRNGDRNSLLRVFLARLVSLRDGCNRAVFFEACMLFTVPFLSVILRDPPGH